MSGHLPFRHGSDEAHEPFRFPNFTAPDGLDDHDE
jgi:hypothetical protein